MINLTIKTLDSQNHKFVVPDAYNIGELKDFIAEQVKVPAAQQRLIFCGRVLNNGVKLADIGINGKVMHLVQKVPRIATTTSGSSSSTTTNTNSRSGHTTGPGFRGWHTHDPAVLFGAIGIPSEFLQPGELPRLINARNHGTGNRVSLAFDMIRRANDVLNRLENPQSTGLPPANDVGTERPQQAEDTSGSIPPEVSVSESSAPEPSAPESSASDTSAPIIQTDPDSVNVSYEVDETFPNTVVVTIDATHHMRMPPGLMRHMHNHLQQHSNSQTTSQNRTEQTAESEATTVPETTPVGPTNQPPGEQTTGTSIPFAIPEQNSRNDRPSDNRASQAINDRLRLKDLIDQLNKLNARLQPFYVMYCQYVNEDPHFETAEGENGSLRAQAVFNGVSEVMHNIAHVYHAISDLRVSFQRPPPRSYQSRPCMLQGTILHTAHSVTTTTAAPPSTTQQPTSTQTTTSSQPHVRHYRIDLTQPDGFSETNAPVRTTAATSTETNTDMPIDPRLESNNTTTVFPSNTPHVLELTFDVTPGGNIDSAEAFVTPNASGPSQPTSASQPSSGGETSNNVSMPIDWMDQMIDVISSGVRRPFMSDQSLDWSSIPTTSTRTPRVTPRTTDSSSTTNPPSQGLHRNRWDVTPRMDPFLPCNSHHFESNLRPLVLTRRSTQGTDRSSSSVTGGSSTTDTSNPTSPNEIRPFSTRRLGRPRRSSYIQDADGFISGIRPILSWGRNHRNNTATTSARNNTRATTGQSGGHSVSDSLAGQIRVSMESMFSSFEGEAFERPRNNLPSNITPNPPGAGSESVPVVPRSDICPREMIMDINEIPYFRDLEGQSLLVDMFMLIANNWTLHDIITMNTSNPSSSLVLYPVTRNSDALVNFILDRIMLNQATNSINIEEAGNRIHHELQSCIRIFVNTIFRCSMPMRTNIDVNESVRRCIIQNLRVIVVYCDQVRAGAPNNIVPNLIVFAERLLSLIVYCCNNRAVFRLCIMAVMQFLPLPAQLHNYLTGEVNFLVDQYWDSISSLHMMHLSIVDYIVPHSSDFEAGETSNVSTDEQSSNPILPSSETTSDSLSDVVIGSQEWHHNVPSEWVPVIARDSQRQRRQGTQPPYSDAYLSGMPNKRRKIVTSSKPQGPLSQIIAKNMEVAMNAAGVAVNKEITATVGADIDVQSAYAERIRTLGRTGLDTHPDFSPDNYPNASKFFYNHNRPN